MCTCMCNCKRVVHGNCKRVVHGNVSVLVTLSKSEYTPNTVHERKLRMCMCQKGMPKMVCVVVTFHKKASMCLTPNTEMLW